MKKQLLALLAVTSLLSAPLMCAETQKEKVKRYTKLVIKTLGVAGIIGYEIETLKNRKVCLIDQVIWGAANVALALVVAESAYKNYKHEGAL